MKCLENKVSLELLHEILEDGGDWIKVMDDDVYLAGYFSHIGVEDWNVSVYGISLKEAVNCYIECHCYEEDGTILTDKDEEQELKTFINVFEQQLQRLKSIKIEGAQ
jgi:hypothetical protein